MIFIIWYLEMLLRIELAGNKDLYFSFFRDWLNVFTMKFLKHFKFINKK